MEKQPFLEDLANILEVEPAVLNEDFKLDEGNWDSLAVVAAIAAIDENFNITVNGEALGECATVRELLDLIQSKVED